MKSSRHVNHSHRHISISYPVSLAQRLYSIFVGPLIVVAIMVIAMKFFSLHLPLGTITFHDLLLALVYTIARLAVAYVLAVIVAFPLAFLATTTRAFESILLPLFDIMQSVPILAFFPILILVFIRFNFLNGAAIFILFLSMVWNLVFTLVGGINIIPKDVISAAGVFSIKGWLYFRKVLLPSLVPQFVTGSILAVAQGWNLIIVAEVLHTYIPHGTSAQDLFGIGSILVQASANGQTNIFIYSVMAMVLAIAFLNFFVWQKLLKFAQRFKFD